MAQDNMESQSEQEIQFKKRARRRLVGAIALVLLMIVLLPMLLEDRVAQTPKEEVVISIPSQDSQLDNKSDATPDKPSDIAQSAAPQTPPVTTSSSVPPPVAASTPEVKAPEVKPTEPPAPVAQNDKPVVKPVEVSAVQEAKSPLKEQDKPKADKPAATGNFFVQIGVFSDPENVKQMQSKLSDKGLKSRADLIDTAKGKKTRLRAGAFSSKKDAEAALDKIKSLGLTGVVVGN